MHKAVGSKISSPDNGAPQNGAQGKMNVLIRITTATRWFKIDPDTLFSISTQSNFKSTVKLQKHFMPIVVCDPQVNSHLQWCKPTNDSLPQ